MVRLPSSRMPSLSSGEDRPRLSCPVTDASQDRPHLFNLPASALDLNPNDHVWTYLQGIFRQDPLAQDERPEDRMERTMTELQDKPAAVRDSFRHSTVEYMREALHGFSVHTGWWLR